MTSEDVFNLVISSILFKDSQFGVRITFEEKLESFLHIKSISLSYPYLSEHHRICHEINAPTSLLFMLACWQNNEIILGCVCAVLGANVLQKSVARLADIFGWSAKRAWRKKIAYINRVGPTSF